jgi:hypothetical protein
VSECNGTEFGRVQFARVNTDFDIPAARVVTPGMVIIESELEISMSFGIVFVMLPDEYPG